MARGLPAVWSSVLALPFIAGGTYGYVAETMIPSAAGIPCLGFGVFLVVIGTYIQLVAAPSQPTMRDGEEVILTRNPAQRAAIAQSVVGLGILIGAGYLFLFTFRPYVYPMTALVGGLYLFSVGTFSYWTNSLTQYYVTTERLIKEYRFLSLVRRGVPLAKVRAVEERKSIWETLVGLGNVRVASGGGAGLEVTVRNIYSSTGFADEIRSRI